MSFTRLHKELASNLVANVWYTKSTTDGQYMAAVDGCWDLIVIKYQDKIFITVNGQGTQAVPVPYLKGMEALGISFKANTHLRHLSGRELLNNSSDLHIASKNSFWLDGEALEIPTFENVDGFIAKLERHGIIQSSDVIHAQLEGRPKAMSERSLQRHFIRTTGLTPYYFHQIKRAQHAVALLQQGKLGSEAASMAGYTDQPHMTRSLKQLIGYTPTQIARNSKSSLQ